VKILSILLLKDNKPVKLMEIENKYLYTLKTINDKLINLDIIKVIVDTKP